MPTPRLAALLLLAGLALAAASCGGPKRKPTYPTEGTLLINGQPAAGVAVFLYSTDPSETEPTRPFAITRLDGTFTLTTSAENDGAPAGEYTVTLLYEAQNTPLAARAKGKPPTFDKKYSDPTTSPLRAKVENKPLNKLEPFDVK